MEKTKIIKGAIILAIMSALTTLLISLKKNNVSFLNLVKEVDNESTSQYYHNDQNKKKKDSTQIIASNNSNQTNAAADQPYSKTAKKHPVPALDQDARAYDKDSFFKVTSNNVSEYSQKIKNYILKKDGRIFHFELNSNSEYQTAWIFAKVPVDHFSNTNNFITSEAQGVFTEKITSNDETVSLLTTEEQIKQLQDQKNEKKQQLSKAENESERNKLKLELENIYRQLQSEKKEAQKNKAVFDYASINLYVANKADYFDPNYTENQNPVWQEVLKAWSSVPQTILIVVKLTVWVIIYSLVYMPIIFFSSLMVKFIRRMFRK